MVQQSRKKEVVPKPITGMERLTMRVSSMINHPIAQERREVRIHRLDTDGEREWSEILEALSETDAIEMTLNDEDESITLRWVAPADDDRQEVKEETEEEAEAPF
ncbi:DUF1654 domain-containing protein [Pseudomonas putida]|uniref:DUF1654 domain-containing protein n=1 Tax=Pseudomonas putida TaxID=303 RepID=UPI002363F0E3|nr:DUF1654 domain-containing protein [Pseudomonas putida]MDD1966156.1 DUF1654 domain-containing protein [Pseudomonas putida]